MHEPGTDRSATERVLVVDDDPQMRTIIERILGDEGYSCRSAGTLEDARSLIHELDLDLIVLDVQMSGSTSLGLVEDLARSEDVETAVLMVSGDDSPKTAHQAALLGASGYLVKPFSSNELLINVDSALQELRRRIASPPDAVEQRQRADDVWDVMSKIGERSSAEAERLLRPLSEAMASRDIETSSHMRRVGELSAMLAQAAGLTASEAEAIRRAAPMHDVGKLAVPDSVLLKPDQLTASERALIERHAQVGHDILAGLDQQLFGLAATIALTHHEWVDGTGYPHRLKGEDIPVVGRIVALADVFDALTSLRPYREALPTDAVAEFMLQQRGTHFDTKLLDLFMDRFDEFVATVNLIPDGRS